MLLKHTVTWMNLKGIMLSERKVMYRMFPCI